MTNITLVTIQVPLFDDQIAVIAEEAAAAGVGFDHVAGALLSKGMFHFLETKFLVEKIRAVLAPKPVPEKNEVSNG